MRYFPLLALCLAFAPLIGISAPVPKKVFAHYMVCLPAAGHEATVEDYKGEILEAQKYGIDGFALNCAAWSKEPHYKTRTAKIFQAAQELKNGFLLFMSADFACQLPFDDFKDMVETYRNHPNLFRLEGRPLVSTFLGEAQGLSAWV